MDVDEARKHMAGARVARLATVTPLGHPHVVPITFALLDDHTIVTAVDHKPKRTSALARLANIQADGRAAVLADHYEDDWDALWWVRADGIARVVEPGAEPRLRTEAVDALAARYAPYREQPPSGALIVVSVDRWIGWSARTGA